MDPVIEYPFSFERVPNPSWAYDVSVTIAEDVQYTNPQTGITVMMPAGLTFNIVCTEDEAGKMRLKRAHFPKSGGYWECLEYDLKTAKKETTETITEAVIKSVNIILMHATNLDTMENDERDLSNVLANYTLFGLVYLPSAEAVIERVYNTHDEVKYGAVRL